MRTLLTAAALLLAGCQSAGSAGAANTATVPGDHSMRLGESLALPDGSQLTYIRVVADSRCRPDVQCIRAGDADIEFRWRPTTGDADSATLNSDPTNQQKAPNEARFGDWRVRLKSLDWQAPPAAVVSISSAN